MVQSGSKINLSSNKPKIYCYSSRVRKHIFLARPLCCSPFCCGPFWRCPFCCGPFWRYPFCCWSIFEQTFFTQISQKYFFLLSIFLIYKNYFFPYFFSFFQKQLKIFCLFVINFFPLYIKNTSSNTPLLFFFAIIPVTDKINSWIFLELIFSVKISVCVNQLLKVTFSGVAVAQSRVTTLNFMQFSIEFCH